jgi:hypothetical protein
LRPILFLLIFSLLNSHKLEVQADVSETASAVTHISEKSGSASTKALAGSILNYKPTNCDQVSTNDDGTSERVRFDNMIYVLDGQAFQAPLDQVRKTKINLLKFYS